MRSLSTRKSARRADQGALPSRRRSSPHPVAALHDRIGNRRLVSLLKSRQKRSSLAGLPVSTPGDRHEREAARHAERILGPAAGREAAAPAHGASSREETPRTGGGSTHGRLGGDGEPLSVADRAYFEARLGVDLSPVRLHSGPRAASLARSVEAKAFTLGRDIVLGTGRYVPGSDADRHTLAHELIHVVQQGGVAPVAGISRAPQPVIQRQELTEIHDPELPSYIREMFGDLMNRVRRIEVGRSTGELHGTDVIAVVRVEARDGAVLAQFPGSYTNPVHAEADAIAAARRRLASLGTEGSAAGGRITVLVTKEPCPGCATEIAALAEELGVAAERVEIIYVARESVTTPGALVSGRTALRTRLSARVGVARGVTLMSVALIPLQMLGEAARVERDIAERGYSPVGVEAFADDPLWVRLARIFSGEAIFGHMLSGTEDRAARFDIVRWREVIRERAARTPEGGTIPFTWQGPNCDPILMGWGPIEDLRVTYTLRDGTWHADPDYWSGRGPVPDLNQIIDPAVPDSAIMDMLTNTGNCAGSGGIA